MAARIDTHKELAGDSEQWLIDNFEDVDIDDREWLEEMFQAINIVETASLVKPGANDLERHVIDWINETVQTSYTDNGYTDGTEAIKSVFADIQHGGCESGFVSHLTRTSEQREFFLAYRVYIESIILETIDGFGKDEVDYIIRGGEFDRIKQRFETDDFSFDNMYQRLSWTAFEETAHRLMSECGLEDC